jgi:hypothetical protein
MMEWGRSLIESAGNNWIYATQLRVSVVNRLLAISPTSMSETSVIGFWQPETPVCPFKKNRYIHFVKSIIIALLLLPFSLLAQSKTDSAKMAQKRDSINRATFKEYQRIRQGTNKKATASDRTYFRGPKGGCYYYSKSGKKVYVDRSICN